MTGLPAWLMTKLASSKVISLYAHKYTTARDRIAQKASKPLRILFCGSDEFSCSALRALQAHRQRHPGSISSIDVLCRTGKRTGRFLQSIQESPVSRVGEEFKLPVQKTDTFTGWQLPKPDGMPINLVITASFGLFVPPHILDSVEYGGLNVHPSMLPDLRGAAPLHHTILSGRHHYGVSLQTLDHESFDKGVVLAQTPFPGIPIPDLDTIRTSDLRGRVIQHAHDILVKAIQDKVYVKPYLPIEELDDRQAATKRQSARETITAAPKFTNRDRQIGIKPWNITEIDRQNRAFGKIWTYVRLGQGVTTRLVIYDMEKIQVPGFSAMGMSDARLTGTGFLPMSSVAYPDSNEQIQMIPVAIRGDCVLLGFNHRDGNQAPFVFLVRQMTLASDAKKSAAATMEKILALIGDKSRMQTQPL